MFIFIGNDYLNANAIRSLSCSQEHTVQVEFNDGSTIPYTTGEQKATDAIQCCLLGIVQLMPCTEELYDVYTESDGFYYHERVKWLALCLDGRVYSVDHCDGYMEPNALQTCSNYLGYFTKDRLSEFPTAPEDVE